MRQAPRQVLGTLTANASPVRLDPVVDGDLGPSLCSCDGRERGVADYLEVALVDLYACFVVGSPFARSPVSRLVEPFMPAMLVPAPVRAVPPALRAAPTQCRQADRQAIGPLRFDRNGDLQAPAVAIRRVRRRGSPASGDVSDGTDLYKVISPPPSAIR